MLAHPPVRMERGEMQRHIDAQFGGDPTAQRAELGVAESFSPGISSVVISSHTFVSRRSHTSVSSTSASRPPHRLR